MSESKIIGLFFLFLFSIFIIIFLLVLVLVLVLELGVSMMSQVMVTPRESGVTQVT